MKHLTLCIISIGMETNLLVSAENSTTGTDAASSQRVYPVLIRNDLVTVAIEVDKPGVRVDPTRDLKLVRVPSS
jgi:hypothetical protein